jgi:hypothetical protein
MLRWITYGSALTLLILMSMACFDRGANTSDLKTPDLLITNLAAAATRGDTQAFLAGMTDSSRKALEEAFSNRASLQQAQEHFQQALTERYGGGGPTLIARPMALSDVLRQLKGMEIIGRKPGNDGTTELQVKSKVETPSGMIVFQEDTLVAREEHGAWKIVGFGFSPAGMSQESIDRIKNRTKALEDVTKRVRDGSLKDRQSAMLALAQAVSLAPRAPGSNEVRPAMPSVRPRALLSGMSHRATETPKLTDQSQLAPADVTIVIPHRASTGKP